LHSSLIVLQALVNGISMAFQWLCNAFAISLRSLNYRFAFAFQSMYNHCTIVWFRICFENYFVIAFQCLRSIFARA
jgi:hypothetical protein